MNRVPIDRTENDPDLFRQVLAEFEGRMLMLLLHRPLQPRDPKGRFTKKGPNHE